ncbi:MAG: phage holin family protein [Patescibacteria group bacterium]
MGIFIYLLVNGFTIFVAAQVLSGVHVNNFFTAIVVAVILGIVNTLIKPILVLLTLPLTVLTFGLFAFIINAFMVLVVSRIVPGFEVDGFLWALLFSLVIAIISSFLNSLLKR